MAGLGAAFGTRRLDLAALDAVIVAAGNGLACGVVPREQALPVLRVIVEAHPACWVEVGCGVVDGRWWYLVEPGGERVTLVDEVQRAPQVLAEMLDPKGGPVLERLPRATADGGAGRRGVKWEARP